MCLKWIENCHYEGECNTRKLLYLQSAPIPVGQQSWNLNHWLWCHFSWFSWKTGLPWVAKMTLCKSFFFLPVLPRENTTQLGTTPSSLRSRTISGTVSGTPGNQEITLLAAVLNWFLSFSLRRSWICCQHHSPSWAFLRSKQQIRALFPVLGLAEWGPRPCF